jgi:GT2 family glycosyltransferase
MSAPCVSVVISTFNRCRELAAALEAVTAQQDAPAHEVIVVDNNSRDRTREVVEAFMSRGPAPLRYVFEPRQGLPHARNAGIRAAAAPIVAFTDDDVVVAPDWVASVTRAFENHPEADCIGGPILPRWPPSGLPSWFTDKQVAPLAIKPRTGDALAVDRRNAAPCLVGANFAFRRAVFDKVGLFDTEYTRNEDREFQLRLWRAGGRGLIVPDVLTYVDVPEDRLTKTYYRSWHAESGRFHSRMRLLEVIDREGGMVQAPPPDACLFGAAPFLYAQLADAVRSTAVAFVRHNETDAFYHESRARYLTSYLRERWRTAGPRSPVGAAADLLRFARRRVRLLFSSSHEVRRATTRHSHRP